MFSKRHGLEGGRQAYFTLTPLVYIHCLLGVDVHFWPGLSSTRLAPCGVLRNDSMSSAMIGDGQTSHLYWIPFLHWAHGALSHEVHINTSYISCLFESLCNIVEVSHLHYTCVCLCMFIYSYHMPRAGCPLYICPIMKDRLQYINDKACTTTRAHCCTNCCIVNSLGYKKGFQLVNEVMLGRDGMTRAENKNDLRSIIKVSAFSCLLLYINLLIYIYI